MSCMLTRGCEYALQAMLFLAAGPPGKPILQRDISAALDIPPHFLGKVLQTLARNKLVISQKGKSGGFILARPAQQITPFDIITAIDGPTFLDGCLLGFPTCNDHAPCPVHNDWGELKNGILKMFYDENISQLSKELDRKLRWMNENRLAE